MPDIIVAGLQTIREAIHELWKAHAQSNGEKVYLEALATLYTAKEEYQFLTTDQWIAQYNSEVLFAQDILEARK